jgi:hypothetical protein
MTISFNGGVDPEEVKFNGQDMEAVILYNDEFPNGVTVWEKVVGVEYTVTSAIALFIIGWAILPPPFGSISPLPSDSLATIFAAGDTVEIAFTNNQTFPTSIKYNGSIFNLNSFLPSSLGGYFAYVSLNPAANLLPFFNSLNIEGNNTTFELIYP